MALCDCRPMARSRSRYSKLSAENRASLRRLQQLLDPFDASYSECDGLTRVLHYVLTQAHVPHRVMMGQVRMGEATFAPHFWIELSEVPHVVIDYRARMWVGAGAPHGVFDLREHPEARYLGELVTFRQPMNKVLAMILAEPAKLP